MRKNLYLVKLQCILNIFIILLLLYYGEFPRAVLCMLLNFGRNIQNIKGVHPNGFYSYFGGFKQLDCYYLIVCCSLGPVLVI